MEKWPIGVVHSTELAGIFNGLGEGAKLQNLYASVRSRPALPNSSQQLTNECFSPGFADGSQ